MIFRYGCANGELIYNLEKILKILKFQEQM